MPSKDELTIERLENALNLLSLEILAFGKRGHELLPMYKSLAAERDDMVEKERLMSEVRDRAARLKENR